MKKNQSLSIIFLISTLIISSCTEVNPIISDEDLVVVWAYLYAGEPVDNIKLTSTISLDTDTGFAPPINTANVALVKQGIRYECELSQGDSGYYQYAGDDLTISQGDLFNIEIEFEEQFITAKTVVPDPPMEVSISNSVMEVPDFSDWAAIREWRESGGSLGDIEVTWQNQDNEWFYVTLENLEENPEEINSFLPERLRDWVFPPINDVKYRIRLPLFTHFGMHKITVYKVNQEYVDLYESRDQDSRDLNEPLTNMENGLGVFSSFNSTSVSLNVVQSN